MTRSIILLCVCGCALGPGTALAATFSLDPASVSLGGARSPDDLFGPNLAPSGLTLPLRDDFPGGSYDNLSAISFGNDFPQQRLFYSVDRNSVGINNSPVALQAAGDGAAGDVFVRRTLSVNSWTLELARRERDLGLLAGFFGDDIDALDVNDDPEGASRMYFAVDPFSFSLTQGFIGCDALSATAGDILIAGEGGCRVFAQGETMIGLSHGNAIDALTIFDRGVRGAVDPGVDVALFSLDPFSFSVMLGSYSAADIFTTTFDGRMELFASANMLGLSASDNIDAIDTLPEPGTAAMILAAAGVWLIKRPRASKRR